MEPSDGHEKEEHTRHTKSKTNRAAASERVRSGCSSARAFALSKKRGYRKYSTPAFSVAALPLSDTSLKIFTSLQSRNSTRAAGQSMTKANGRESGGHRPIEVLIEHKNRCDVTTAVAVVGRRPNCTPQSMTGEVR